MSRVFFPVQLPPRSADRDLSSANRYGTVHFIMEANPPPSLAPGQAIQQTRKALRDFDETQDYIAWAGGDPVATFIVGAVLAEKGVRAVKWLKYDRERSPDGTRTGAGFYTPVTIRFRTP